MGRTVRSSPSAEATAVVSPLGALQELKKIPETRKAEINLLNITLGLK
jgi:hypothetical protein